MQGGFTLHGIDESHIIDTGGELGEQIAHPDSGLPMLTEFPKTRLAVAGLGGEELKFPSRVKGGASTPFKFRLVIEGIDVAQATRAEDLNDPFGSGREMRSG